MRLSAAIQLILYIVVCSISTSNLVFADDKREKSVSLNQVIDEAFRRNFDVKITKLEAQLGELNIAATKALYDLTTTFLASHAIDRQEPAVPVFGTENDATNFEAAVNKRFASGTGTSLTLKTERLSTNSNFSTVNPTFESSLQIALTQPLLQNFLGRNDIANTKVAVKQADILLLEIEDQIETIVSQLITTYWSLAYQQQLIQYADEAVTFATALLQYNRRNKRLGLAEANEVIAAEANLKVREQERTTTEFDLQRTALSLARLLSAPATTRYVASGDLVATYPTTSRADAIAKATQRRRDLRIVREDIAISDINIARSSNQLWPSLDLQTSLQLNGLDGSLGGSQEEFFTTNNITFFIGGQLTYNWDNKAKRSELRESRLQKRQKLLLLKRTEQDVVFDIQDAYLEVETQANLLTQAKEVVKLQQQKLAEENKRLRQGRSDTTRLVRNQDDLIEAQKTLILIALRYQLAWSALLRQQNTLLSYYSGKGQSS